MRKNSEKILREVLASIVSSKLTVNEMREFAHLLLDDSFFSRQLSMLVEDLSYKLRSQENFDWQEPASSETAYGGLTDLAYSIVQRKRLSKARLLDAFSGAGVSIRNSGLSADMSVRDLIDSFLNKASSSQADRFMQYLGVEMGNDAYLSGIDPVNRR